MVNTMGRKPYSLAKKFSNAFLEQYRQKLSDEDLIILERIENKKPISHDTVIERNTSIRDREFARIEEQERLLAMEKKQLIEA